MTMPAPRYFTLHTDKPLIYDVCGQLISKGNFLHHRRTFDLNVFILVTQMAGNTPFPLTNIFLRVGEEHFGHQASLGKLSYLWVHLLGDKPFEAAEEFPLKSNSPYCFPEQGKVTSSKRVSSLFRQLMDLSLAEQMYLPLMLNYTLSLLLLEVSGEQSHAHILPVQKQPPVILSICEWIRGNYYKTFTVSELFGYQTDYLSALFKKHMSVSLIGYTNRLRIEVSKTLLANYDLSIKKAAYSCGFPDEKYFMKVFKKFEGMTPWEYKRDTVKALLGGRLLSCGYFLYSLPLT